MTVGFFVGLTGLFGVYTNTLPQVRSEVPPYPNFYYFGIDLKNFDSSPIQKLADAGEKIIFGRVGGFARREVGKGQCPLCHTFNAGDLGERAPSLIGIIERAERRIKEPRYLNPDTVLQESYHGSGRAATADEYIAESHVCPSCYVVKGFGTRGTDDRESPMPAVHKVVISLTIEEMIFVHTWLYVHDGKKPPPPSQIRADLEKFIPEGERHYSSLYYSKLKFKNVWIDSSKFALALDTPQEMLKKLDCAACHRIPTIEYAKVGIIGPLLNLGSSAEKRVSSPWYQAAIRAGKAHAHTPKEYIIESIMEPSAFIAPITAAPNIKFPKKRWTFSGFHKALCNTAQTFPRNRPWSSTPDGDIIKVPQELAIIIMEIPRTLTTIPRLACPPF